MPAKEIKELRKSGKLLEAFNMAKTELDAQPDNIWAKRNISWVYYDYLSQSIENQNIDNFIHCLNEIKKLELPIEDKMLADSVAWKIGMIMFSILKTKDFQEHKLFKVYELAKTFSYTQPSESYSFLFKGLHKFLKEGDNYLQFADWWDFSNFREEDYQKEKLPDGKEVMSIVEQAHIAYAKHLLPKQNIVFDKEKVISFIEKLTFLEEKQPKYQYPAFFKAKLLLALGNKNNMLESLLPFAKKKSNDFWVWEILAEAFIEEPKKVFACYCKALSCKSPEEMLVNLRQKMARIFVSKNYFNEAKTEIELLVKSRTNHGFGIPNEVVNWQSQEWYKNAITKTSNYNLYKKYIPEAESILYFDIPEELVIVNFVNSDRKMLNFVASESKFGYLKYDRFFNNVQIGDVLKVRFQGGSNEGMFHLNTAIKTEDDVFRKQFYKEVEGNVRISEGKAFGFLSDIFIHPSLVSKLNLTNGMPFIGKAIKTYNKEKKLLDWKLI